ncbi:hypothetical protein VTK73DRAFT_1958 [Phialemonium thermophilum]|uniref:Uncharacterized protein n=1 Tax=Phialemonium thermophilum TaxID=223376 RepID=A0ABR3X7N8_9PEZI
MRVESGWHAKIVIPHLRSFEFSSSLSHRAVKYLGTLGRTNIPGKRANLNPDEASRPKRAQLISSLHRLANLMSERQFTEWQNPFIPTLMVGSLHQPRQSTEQISNIATEYHSCLAFILESRPRLN